MNEFETAVVNEPSVFGLYLFISEREREREREGERERESMGASEVHALSHHPSLNSLCRSYPDPLTSTTHFFLWLPCITDTQNHKHFQCDSGTVCGLWRDLHLKSFYFY